MYLSICLRSYFDFLLDQAQWIRICQSKALKALCLTSAQGDSEKFRNSSYLLYPSLWTVV